MKIGQIFYKNKGLKTVLYSLRYRNYRLFFAGQSISLVGTWMQMVAISWLVYHLTNSALLLGLVGFFSQIPSFVLTPFTGVFVDRWNRHRILVITQTLSMIQAFALAFLTLTGTINILSIILLSLSLGLINAFDMPARQSFVIEMVEKKEDLPNAIALNSSLVNVARFIGPAVAGLLVAAVGEGFCFLINGISYVAVIIALLAMKVNKITKRVSINNIPKEIKEGFKYSFGFAPIRSILLLLGLVSLVGMPYIVLMPIFAKDILHGGAHTLGFLMAAAGIGALVGGIYLASRKSVLGLVKILTFATGIFGLGLIIFAFSKNLYFSLSMMLVSGFGMLLQIAASNTLLQTITEDDKRGRVMSFFTMAFMGMSPFGNLIAGAMADKIGAPNTVLISGVICIIGAIIFLTRLPSLRKIIRPLYVKMGIIPQVASGIQIASEINIPP
ncbi:MAG: MFS transporter, partial [Actinobacteria bacterium]|nr:MFS transporter [Actinomycetota bacterium]